MALFRKNPGYATKSVLIANGQGTSAVVDLAGDTIVGVWLPAAFTGVAITFTASPDNVASFVSVRDGAGNALSITVAQGQYVPVDPNKFLGVRYLKLVSGSNEADDRTVTLATRPV